MTATPLRPGPRSRPQPTALLRVFVDRVLVQPVREGRLRDVGWPQGLRELVVVAVGAFVVALGLVLGSSALRAALELGVPPTVGFSLPRSLLWLILTLVLVSVSLLQTAALHGVWWFRLITLFGSVVVMAAWGVRGVSGTAWLSSALTAVLIIALLVLALLRRRKTFVWWEFPVVLGLLGGAVVAGMASAGMNERRFGFDLPPVLTQQTLQILGEFALPAAIAAGTAVAELTVSATVVATRITHRFAFRRTAFVILLVVLAVRVVQTGWQLAHLEPYRQDLRTVLGSVAGVLLLALVAGALLRLSGRHGRALQVSELSDDLSRIALPVGGAIMLALVPLLVVSFALQTAIVLDPTGTIARLPFDYAAFSSTGMIVVSRLLLAVVLIVLAVRAGRRGQAERAVLLGSIAVMLILMSSNFLTGGVIPVAADLDVFNLVVTLVAVVTGVVLALRRRLSGERALGLAGLLVLSALFAHRDFVSDPLGVVLGFSGAALVLFGLCWDFLTGCAAGNEDSPRFPLPTRVLLLSANLLFAVTVLAFISLVRDPGATVSLEDFAALGDTVLGTALLAATCVGVLSAIRGRRSVT